MDKYKECDVFTLTIKREDRNSWSNECWKVTHGK